MIGLPEASSASARAQHRGERLGILVGPVDAGKIRGLAHSYPRGAIRIHSLPRSQERDPSRDGRDFSEKLQPLADDLLSGDVRDAG